jgi:hypothetical protein
MNYKDISKIDPKLVIFLGYFILLLLLSIKMWDIRIFVWGYILFVITYCLIHFGRDFVAILISPAEIIYKPIEYWQLNKFLKDFKKKNVPSETVIILGQSDWYKFKAWMQASVSLSEVKPIIKYLESIGRDFSVYTNSNTKDVEEIMRNKEIKEVYFVGHGTSHVFQLNTGETLYYCDFNDEKYRKDFVHQIHCGTRDGKSLIDYVVPDKNKNNCISFRKTINSFDIQKAFKRKIKEISK